MNRNDGDVWGVASPAVEPGAGQKLAGGVLRGLGLLMFFGGASFVMSLLMLVLAQWSELRAVRLDPWWGAVSIAVAALGVMVLGSVMGVCGMMLSGALRPITGERFLKWSLAAILRDVSLALASLLLFGAVSGAATFKDPRLLLLLVPGGVLALLGVAGMVAMKRVRAAR